MGRYVQKGWYFQGVGIPEDGGWYTRGGIPEGRRWVYQSVGEYVYSPDMGLWIPTPVLISSGSHHKTYPWQAGGAHPTGMFSCLTFFVS